MCQLYADMKGPGTSASAGDLLSATFRTSTFAADVRQCQHLSLHRPSIGLHTSPPNDQETANMSITDLPEGINDMDATILKAVCVCSHGV